MPYHVPKPQQSLQQPSTLSRRRRRRPLHHCRQRPSRRRQCQLQFVFSFSVLTFLTLLGSKRSYTIIKCLGDGSFGTVWLCDWHGTLPPNTPLSPMQCGAGARPEWAGKRLVAVKLMKRQWAGGWEECQKLKELQVRIVVFSARHIFDFPLIQSVSSYNPFPS